MSRFNMSQYKLILLGSLLASSALSAQDATPLKPDNYNGPVNYVRTWEMQAPFTALSNIIERPLKEVKQTTHYFDGLGRPIQTVLRQGAMETGGSPVDLVTAHDYD